MAEASAQEEPSMEEILASIRRIISEDGEEETEAAPEEEAEEEAEPEPEPEPALEAVEEADADLDDGFAPIETEEETAPEPEPEPEPVLQAVPDQPAADVFEAPAAEEAGADVFELTDIVPEGAPGADPIVSQVTAAATSEHLRALSGLLVRNYPNSENTLEGLVREMLKPMLKEWLDANLPHMVEAMVNKEISRITGRD